MKRCRSNRRGAGAPSWEDVTHPPSDPGALPPTLTVLPPGCSQRTGRCSSGRCCNLALPGISPVHPCRDNGVFKAETAEEYIQEPLIKATILCTTEHPSRKCTELVPQNNYMCRVLCKHSFYVHQHSWGQCLKIQLCNAFCVVREPFKWYHRFSKITCSSSVSIGPSKETFFRSIIFFFLLLWNRFVSDAYGEFVSLSLATFSPPFTNEGERNGELFLALQQTPASKSVSSETTWGGVGSLLMALQRRNLRCLTASTRKQSSCCWIEGQSKVKTLCNEAGPSL